MQTDGTIYQYLSIGSEAFRVLTGGIILSGAYSFSSITLKGVERRIDAMFEPQDHDGPVYIVEFQAQWKPAAWYNLVAKIGLYGEQYPARQIRGVLIFPYRSDEAKQARNLATIATDMVSIVYLENFLPRLIEQEPNNPYIAVLAPLIWDDEKSLQHMAPQLWRTVHTAPVPIAIRDKLEDILEFWFFERFKNFSEQEVLTMLQILTPLEETRAYQSILAKGIMRGKAEGRAEGEAIGITKGEAKGRAEGEAKALMRLLTRRFKKVPKKVQKLIATADIASLEKWFDRAIDADVLQQIFE